MLTKGNQRGPKGTKRGPNWSIQVRSTSVKQRGSKGIKKVNRGSKGFIGVQRGPKGVEMVQWVPKAIQNGLNKYGAQVLIPKGQMLTSIVPEIFVGIP